MKRRRGNDSLVGGYTCARTTPTPCGFLFTEQDYVDGWCVIEQGERWCTECTPDAIKAAAAGIKRKVHPRGLAAASPKRRRREEEEDEEQGDEKKEEPTGALSATEVPFPPVSAPAPATEVPVTEVPGG